ncbi:MAG: cation transporter [Collinsella sp.]|nr:cation transporter [Collinsella sp.]
MRKVFKLDSIDCANCARKLQEAIASIPEVTAAKVNFMTQKLTLEAPDEAFGEAERKAIDLIAQIEPDCEVIR